MSRTPANASLTVVRGATWEDEFTYTDESGAAVDLTGYEARMQVRTADAMFGTTGDETLVMELSTTGDAPQLSWDTAAEGRLRIRVEAVDTAVLNPDNAKKNGLAYGLEVYTPAGVSAEYVIPLVQGRLIVLGEVVR